MDSDPVPSYFGVRYVLWFLWSNAITMLMLVQGAFTALTLDPTLVSHTTFHWLLIGNAVICAALAQIKRNNPPPVGRNGPLDPPKENLK
jgi:hypothetical protein